LGTLAVACDAGIMLAGGNVAMELDSRLLETAAKDPRAFERQTIDRLRSAAV
ncbi:ABC transporter, partial [Pseudomonas syringae]